MPSSAFPGSSLSGTCISAIVRYVHEVQKDITKEGASGCCSWTFYARRPARTVIHIPTHSLTFHSVLQYRVLQTTASVPSQLAGVIEKENFEKSKHYNKDKFKFAFVTGLWGQLLSTAILSLNVIPMLWDLSGRVVQSAGLGHGEVKQTLAFVVIGSLFSEILNLPFAIYSNFVIEERHGFNKYTPSFYAKDKVKKFVVGQSIMLPIVAAVIQIIRAGGQYFFFYLWVFLFFVTIALITIYPDFIAPLFDKFTPSFRKEISGQRSKN